MRDTPPDIEGRVRELFSRRSPGDRVRMTCEMFDLGRALLEADIRARNPEITDAELRVRLFERIYGGDFDEDERRRLVARLRG